MKRRELLKKSILGFTASTLAVAGCKNKETISTNPYSDNFNIIPKQTAQYEFSCPLPFNIKTIDEMCKFYKEHI